MLFGPSLETLMFRIPAIIIAIVVHEFAHGRVAYHFGDHTAKNDGRLTLNPLKHLDVVGSLFLLIFGFGWAKPVMVNPHLLRNPKRDMALISLAGPAVNLLAALVIGRILIGSGLITDPTLLQLALVTVQINVVLAVFNMFPIPPLDGSKVLAYFLPPKLEYKFYEFSQYGMLLLMAMVFLFNDILSAILTPFMSFFMGLAVS